MDDFDPESIKNRADENLHCLFWPGIATIGRGRISPEGARDLRESRERRDKIFAVKTENTKILDQKRSSFQWGIFIFLAAKKLTFEGRGITSKLASQWQ